MENEKLLDKLAECSDEACDAFYSKAWELAEVLVKIFTAEVIIEYAKSRTGWWADFLAQEEIESEEPKIEVAKMWVVDFIYADFTESDLTA